MIESLKIIFEETLSVYKLGTLDGRLFIPFIICCLYILLSPSKEDDRARKYFVYPSLILCLFIFNPVFIHYMIKFMEDPERVVRVFWPLPIGGVFIYCIIRAYYDIKTRWKKCVLLVGFVLVLLFITEGSHAGISFVKADNAEKLIYGAKEVSDTIYTLNEGQEARVLVPNHLFFWMREYNAAIILPYQHKTDFMYDDNDELDLDVTAQKALEADCKYIVISTAGARHGALEDYGYELVSSVAGTDCEYQIYMLTE